MINVTRSSMPDFDEYVNEIKDIWDSRWLTNNGPKHRLLQEELKSFLGARQVELFCNGHTALELTIQAMGLSGEVITTPFTFASTTHAIVRNSLTPIFCDIDPVTYTIDTNKIEALITPRTTAIIPVHVYGNICDVEAIDKIADRYNLKVIYDAAHAFGVKYKGKGVGSFGDASMFSFHATKVFHTIEGGCVCFGSEELGQALGRLKNFGISAPEQVDAVGSNAKMNEFSAAMGLCNLRHIGSEIEKRKAASTIYRSRLQGIGGITLNSVSADTEPNYAYFPVVFDKEKFGSSRDEIAERLSRNGITARKYFYPLTGSFDCYKNMFDRGSTPVAQRIADNILTLPLYAGLTEEDVNKICDVILNM